MLAFIGGSGLSTLEALEVEHRRMVRTPYGEPSSPLVFGRMGDHEAVFLARHGHGHTIAPHEINYRANIWALREQSVEGIVSVATVGGIRSDLPPGSLVVPDQILDYTWGRRSTYFEGEARVTHADFTQPYTEQLRRRILSAGQTCGEALHDGATYATTQGPRLETAAEIRRYQRDGADLVGMTGMPEAVLARELALPYATLCLVVNHAAGLSDSRQGIDMAQIDQVMSLGMARVGRILQSLVATP